jgi:hypothetical protein
VHALLALGKKVTQPTQRIRDRLFVDVTVQISSGAWDARRRPIEEKIGVKSS